MSLESEAGPSSKGFQGRDGPCSLEGGGTEEQAYGDLGTEQWNWRILALRRKNLFIGRQGKEKRWLQTNCITSSCI